jgi:hypothetical protein
MAKKRKAKKSKIKRKRTAKKGTLQKSKAKGLKSRLPVMSTLSRLLLQMRH